MKKNPINNFFQNFSLLLVSVLLFILANPNFINNKGFGFLAWFYYIPLLFLIHKASIKSVWLYGGLFGLLFYSGYAYWLVNYGLECLIFICCLYFVEYIFLFLFLKYIDKKSIIYNWLLLWLVISAFEFIKTKGFLGFNYGVTVYTQWRYIPLIQICDFVGPFYLNSFIIFFSCIVYSFIVKISEKTKYLKFKENNLELNQYNSHLNYLSEHKNKMKHFSLMLNSFILIVYIVSFVFILVYGLNIKIIENNEYITISAIQQNENPDDEGIDSQINNFKTLHELTNTALEMNENIDIIVWPETAIVPSITYKYYRLSNGPVPDSNEEKSINFVVNVLNYINRKNEMFVIGNNGIVFEKFGNPENSKSETINSYTNDALVFESGKNVIPPVPQIYSKIKLVPFSESFPYKNIFPKLYEQLEKMYGYLYTPGSDYKVFKLNNFYFSTPICFEDTFPEVARNMYKAGARCLINLTNDSWSKSISCQYQHLSMAVFRSIENRIPTVRSATSGITCVISEKGEVTQSVAAFTPGFITSKINVIEKNRKPTFYCQYGILLEYLLLVFTGALLLIQIITDIIKYVKGKHYGKKR